MSPDGTVAAPAYRSRRLRTDVFLTIGGKAAFIGLGVLVTVIIARTLGPSGQGAFAVAFNLTLILVQIGGVGLPVSNPYVAAREPVRVGAIAANSIWLAAIVGAVLIVAAAALEAVAPSVLAGLGWRELLVTLAAIPGALATLFLQSLLLGQGRMVAYNVIDVSQAATAVAGLAIGFAVFDMGVTGALAVLTATRYLSVSLGLIALRREARPFRALDRALVRRMLRFGFRVYVAALIAFLLIRMDLLMVNALVGQAAAGLYSVSASIGEGLYLLPTVVALNLLPRVAKTDGHEMSAEVFRSVGAVYGALCVLSVPAVAVLVPVVFGGAYDRSVELYFWLVGGIFCLGMLNILAAHYSARGYPRQLFLAWVAGLALNLAINLVFLPLYGVFVAPLASTICYALVLVAHVRFFARETGGYSSLTPTPQEVSRFVRVALRRA